MKNVKLIYTKGLPASGKTTWANEQVLKGQGSIVNVNKDDLRSMIHANQHSSGREDFVLKIQDQIIISALNDGKNVIVSDTNFHEKHLTRFNNIAQVITQYKVEVEEKDFTDVPLDVCIERDKGRGDKAVGEKVIRNMHNTYLKKDKKHSKNVPLLEQDKTLDGAVIIDLDGTLAHMTTRGPFHWKRVGEDEVDDTIASLARDLHSLGNKIIIVSGRDGVCQPETEQWLKDNNIPYDEIFMRKINDNRKDSIVKEEIFTKKIQDKWYIRFVLDDRLSVCRMWHEKGLKLFRVGDPDADF